MVSPVASPEPRVPVNEMQVKAGKPEEMLREFVVARAKANLERIAPEHNVATAKFEKALRELVGSPAMQPSMAALLRAMKNYPTSAAVYKLPEERG